MTKHSGPQQQNREVGLRRCFVHILCWRYRCISHEEELVAVFRRCPVPRWNGQIKNSAPVATPLSHDGLRAQRARTRMLPPQATSDMMRLNTNGAVVELQALEQSRTIGIIATLLGLPEPGTERGVGEVAIEKHDSGRRCRRSMSSCGMLPTREALQSLESHFVAAVTAVFLGGIAYANEPSEAAPLAPDQARPVPADPATSGPSIVVQPAQFGASTPLSSTSIHGGISFVEETVGVPGGGPGSDLPLPLIVTLHGLGDVPEHFIQVLRALPLRARVAAARAPVPFAQGYSWLPPSRPRDIDERTQPVRRAVERLAPAIVALAAARPTCGRPLVVGFSQGAMVAYWLAASPRPVISAAFPIAGYLPPSLTPARVPAGAPRIVALHGTADSVVALGDDLSSVSGLARAGYAIELRRYPGTDHTVSPQMRAELGELVRNAARAMGCGP